MVSRRGFFGILGAAAAAPKVRVLSVEPVVLTESPVSFDLRAASFDDPDALAKALLKVLCEDRAGTRTTWARATERGVTRG